MLIFEASHEDGSAFVVSPTRTAIARVSPSRLALAPYPRCHLARLRHLSARRMSCRTLRSAVARVSYHFHTQQSHATSLLFVGPIRRQPADQQRGKQTHGL